MAKIPFNEALRGLVQQVRRPGLGQAEHFLERVDSPLLFAALSTPGDVYRESNALLEQVAAALPAVGPLAIKDQGGFAVPLRGLDADRVGVIRKLSRALREKGAAYPLAQRYHERLERDLLLRYGYWNLLVDASRSTNRVLTLRQLVNYGLRAFLSVLAKEINDVLQGSDFSAQERLRRAFALLIEHKEEYLRDVSASREGRAKEEQEHADKLRDLADAAFLRQTEAAVLAGESVAPEALERAALIWSRQRSQGTAAPALPPSGDGSAGIRRGLVR